MIPRNSHPNKHTRLADANLFFARLLSVRYNTGRNNFGGAKHMCLDRVELKKAQQGNLAAVEKLLKKYERYVFNTALGFFKDSFLAADAAQEAMIKIYRSLGSFRFESSFKSWIFRITVNACKDMLRRQKAEMPLEDSAERLLSDDSASPEQALDAKETKRTIIDAIKSLDDDHRNVIILRELNGQSYDQIARTLDISVGTVKSRIFRARTRLKEILG